MADLQSADVLLNSSLKLQFARINPRTGVHDSETPAILRETFRPPTGDPVSILYDSFQNGGAFSRRWLPNTYDRARNLHMRTPTIVLPSGYTEALTIPAAMSGQAYPITCSAVLGTTVFVFAGRYAAIMAATDTEFTIDGDFGASFAALSATVFDGVLYVSGYDPANNPPYTPVHIWKRAGGIWIQSTTAIKHRFAEDTVNWVRKTQSSNRLIASTSLGAQPAYYQHIPSGLDPMDETQWSTEILVGRKEFPINSIGITPRHVLFGKGEGLFDVDERDFTPNYTPWFRQTYEQTNGTQLSILNKASGEAVAYLSHWQGVHQVILNGSRQTGSQPCGPGTGTPTTTNAFGAPTAQCVDGTGWVGCAFHDGQDASVWFGRDRDEIGAQVPGPMVWHGSECDLLGQRISHMRVYSINGDPNLWIAAQDNGAGTVRLYRQSIPLGSNPLQDYLWPSPTSRVAQGFHEFAESGDLYLPDEDFNDATALKVLRRLKMVLPGASSSITQEILASIDGGAYVSQGTAEAPYWSQVPVSASQVGRAIKLKLTGTGTRRVPFQLQAVEMDADVIVEQSSVIEIPIVIALFQPMGTSVPSGKDPDTQWVTLLDLAQTQGVIDVQVRGIKQAFRAKVLPFAGRQLVSDKEGRPWYQMATLRLDVIEPPMGFLVWDGATSYDSIWGFVPS